MEFASPLWLWGLLPWAGWVLWMLIRRPRPVPVPFARLWQLPHAPRARRRGWSRPPGMVLLLMMTALLAILGAAGPTLPMARTDARPVTILVDRGITMSAGRPIPRYLDLARWLQPALLEKLGPRRSVILYPVPGAAPVHTSINELTGALANLAPTAIDTHPLLPSVIGPMLAQATGPILLLSDQPLQIDNPRLIQLAPHRPLEAVGIAALGARLKPHPQIMVRVRNQSRERQATLTLRSGDVVRREPVDLPPAPGQRTVFVDLPALGETVHAELEPNDSGWAGAQAWLVRQNRPIRVQAHGITSPELGRMITVYNQSQPASDEPATVAVVGEGVPPPADQPAVLVPSHVPQSAQAARPGAPSVAESPLTAHVDWARILQSARLATLPPGHWQTLISSAGRPALALGHETPRRLWLGIDAPDWPQYPDFVIFWKNVFDALGGGQPVYAADIVQTLPQSRPGLYERPNGPPVALNASDVLIPSPPGSAALAALAPSQAPGRDLAPWLFLIALACALAAMATKIPRLSREKQGTQLTPRGFAVFRKLPEKQLIPSKALQKAVRAIWSK